MVLANTISWFLLMSHCVPDYLPQMLLNQHAQGHGTWRRDLRHYTDLKVLFKHFLWLFNNFFRLGVYGRKKDF